MRDSVVRAVVGLVAVGLAGVTALPAQAAPEARPRTGSVQVVLKAPKGVPAQVMLKGRKRMVVTKAVKAASTRRKVKLPAGTYAVSAPRVVAGGVFYKAVVKPKKVTVKARRTTRLVVRWVKVKPAATLRAASVAERKISLTWTGRKGASYEVRRTTGEKAAKGRRAGSKVYAGRNRRATDAKVKPGQRYTYALFMKAKGRKARWQGPFATTAGTPDPARNVASYDLREGSVVVDAGDKGDKVVRRADGQIWFTPAASRPALTLGAGVVLPVSKELPAGMVAVVDETTPGREVRLRGAALGEVFDSYTATMPLDGVELDVPLEARAPSGRRAADVSCSMAGGAATDFKLSLRPRGDLEIAVDDWELRIGGELGFALTVGADISFNKSMTCNLVPVEQMIWPLPTAPVPTAVMFAPSAGLTVEGALEMKNMSYTYDTGFSGAVTIPIPSLVPRATGAGHATSWTTEPVVSGSGKASLGLGGYVTAGFGSGAQRTAGVIAGVGADLKVSAGVRVRTYPGDDGLSTCYLGEREAGLTPEIRVEAFVANWSISAPVKINAWARKAEGTDGPFPSGCVPLDTADPLWGMTPVITSDDLAPAKVGDPYVHAFGVMDDRPGSFVAEGLPDGLRMDGNRLVGEPTDEGEFGVTVTFVDELGQLDTWFGHLEVVGDGRPSIRPATLPLAYRGDPYSFGPFEITDDRTGEWSVSPTAPLPAGLELSESGDVVGTPTVAGDFTFTVEYTDSLGAVGRRTFALSISDEAADVVAVPLASWSSAYRPDLSPDGRYVAYAAYPDDPHSPGRPVHLWDTVTGERTLVTPPSADMWADAVAVSRDAARVAYVNGGHVYVWDRASGVTTNLTAHGQHLDPDSNAGDVSISDDGRFVAFGTSARYLVDDRPSTTNMYVADLERGGIVPVPEMWSTNGAISPDGTYVESRGRLWNRVTGENHYVSGSGALAMSYDASIVVHAGAGQVAVTDRRTGRRTVLHEGPVNESGVAVSGDGRYVVYSTAQWTNGLLRRVDLQTGAVRTLSWGRSFPGWPVLSHTGSTVLFVSGGTSASFGAPTVWRRAG